jgi:single-strand DNA-binding protein
MATRTKEPPATPPTDEAHDTGERQLPSEITKVGNLTRDPERGFGKERGTPFVRFAIANNRPKVPGDWAGEMVTTFYDITAFGTLADNVADSLEKGDRVVVVGKPEVEKWTDNDGNARETRRIIATAIGAELRWATVTISRAKPPRQTWTPVSDVGDDEEPF